MKQFYRTQREVTSVVNDIIDEYWANKLTDEELEGIINIVLEDFFTK